MGGLARSVWDWEKLEIWAKPSKVKKAMNVYIAERCWMEECKRKTKSCSEEAEVSAFLGLIYPQQWKETIRLCSGKEFWKGLKLKNLKRHYPEECTASAVIFSKRAPLYFFLLFFFLVMLQVWFSEALSIQASHWFNLELQILCPSEESGWRHHTETGHPKPHIYLKRLS